MAQAFYFIYGRALLNQEYSKQSIGGQTKNFKFGETVFLIFEHFYS